MDTLVDAFRVLLLVVAVTVAMLVAKFGWVGFREGSSTRPLGAAAFILILATPTVTALFRFGEDFYWATLVYAAGLVCAAAALARIYRVHPEWTRVRLAAEREEAAGALAEKRAGEDVLRADDRTAQAGERADSRDMYDAGHLDESTATYDRRVERREAADDNREHSHQLQDEERQTTRDDEDRRL